jgi:hypothetical protein
VTKASVILEEPDEIEPDASAGGDEGDHHALFRCEFPNGGTVSYYKDGRFEAVCRHPSHLPKGRCRLTRTCERSLDETSEAQGRPLGLMSSWLLRADMFASKEEHCDLFALFVLTHEERLEARHQLQALPFGPQLCDAERASREGEGAEPVGWA